VLEGLWVSFVRLGDSVGSWEPRVHQVSLNAGCCKCVGHPGLALCCCCCFRMSVCVYVLVACVVPSLWYIFTLFPLLRTFFFLCVCDVV